MRLVSTTGDLARYYPGRSVAAPVEGMKATGFRHLDYSFYRVMAPGHRFMTDDWVRQVEEAGEAAAKLGFDFVQAHSPDYNPFADPADTVYHERGMLATLRSVEACGRLGIPAIVVHSGYGTDYLYPGDREGYFAANRPFYEALIPAMEKWNVKVCIENSAEGNMGSRYFFMTAEERKRHDVRPGISGLAQIRGRNALSWEGRLAADLEYVENVTFMNDMRIFWETLGKVLKREGISTEGMDTAEDYGDYLLRTGKIDETTYEEKQQEAQEILKAAIT